MKGRNDIVTVVTVVYNGAQLIERTIESVINQTYSPIEYIVIDGGSTDGTVDIIERYAQQLSYWISEPDKGIYYAMNKAIDRAGGKWINFMNAGDYFYSDQAVEQVFLTEEDIEAHAIIYGDAEFRLKNIAYIVEAGERCDTNEYMPFSHQAAFIRNDVAKKYKFDTNYRIIGDTALSLTLLKEGYTFKRIATTICSYDASEGLSVQNGVKRSNELVQMQIRLNGADGNSSYFKKYLREAKLKQYVKSVLPEFIWMWLREREIKKTKNYRNIND